MKVKEYPQLEILFKDKYYSFVYSFGIGMFKYITLDSLVVLNAELVDFLFLDEFFYVAIKFNYGGTSLKLVRLGRRY